MNIPEGVHAFGRSQCREEIFIIILDINVHKQHGNTQLKVYNLSLWVNIRQSEVEKFKSLIMEAFNYRFKK